MIIKGKKGKYELLKDKNYKKKYVTINSKIWSINKLYVYYIFLKMSALPDFLMTY
jgi:hypothetical protein